MLEDLGKCTGNKQSDTLVQSDTLGEGLNNRIQDEGQSLSGNLWTGEIDSAMTNLKQMEKRSEGLKFVQDSEERSTLARGYFQKREEISNCGFGPGLERTLRQSEIQEIHESMRRIRQLDLKPYMWNTVDIRI